MWVRFSCGSKMDSGATPSSVTAADLTQTSTCASLARDRDPREKSPAVRSAISDQQKWIYTPTQNDCCWHHRSLRGLRAAHPPTQQTERNVSRTPARQWISLRACAGVCGRLAGTLIPKNDPFFSHTHTNHTSGRNVAHVPEGLETVRKEGYRSVQVTRLPTLCLPVAVPW